jgi:hypothetical protein
MKTNKEWVKRFVWILIFISIFYCYLELPLKPDIHPITSSFSDKNQINSYFYLLNQENFEQSVKQSIAKSDDDLSENLTSLPKNTTYDIFPYDIAQIFRNNLTYKPSPIIQAYSAYTPKLDTLNELHFDENPPDFFIFDYASIDGRYPFYDEPQTLLKILTTYQYYSEYKNYLYLVYDPSRKDSGITLKPIGSAEGELNKEIYLPLSDKVIIGSFELKQSIYGKIKSVFYKPSPTYITFILSNGVKTEPYRYVTENTANAAILSPYLSNNEDFKDLIQNRQPSDNIVKGFIITTDSDKDYLNNFIVNFSEWSNKNLTSVPEKRIIRMINLDKGDTFTGISRLTINNITKNSLFLHAKVPYNSISIKNVSIYENSSLNFAIGLDPEIWFKDLGDGVEYSIEVSNSSDTKLIFSKYIDPRNNVSDRKWFDFSVNLSEYFKNDIVSIKLITSPGPRNDTSFDWAYWGDPIFDPGLEIP